MCFRHGPTCGCQHCNFTPDHTDADTANALPDGLRQEHKVSDAASSSESQAGQSWWRRLYESYDLVPQTHRTFEVGRWRALSSNDNMPHLVLG
jgi:hypothetical protein